MSKEGTTRVFEFSLVKVAVEDREVLGASKNNMVCDNLDKIKVTITKIS